MHQQALQSRVDYPLLSSSLILAIQPEIHLDHNFPTPRASALQCSTYQSIDGWMDQLIKCALTWGIELKVFKIRIRMFVCIPSRCIRVQIFRALLRYFRTRQTVLLLSFVSVSPLLLVYVFIYVYLYHRIADRKERAESRGRF